MCARSRVAAALFGTLVLWLSVAALPARAATESALGGVVASAGQPLPGLDVSLYQAAASAGGSPVLLATAHTGQTGAFSLTYRPAARSAVLYLLAGRGGAVQLAAALASPAPRRVVVNERTTVAAGFSLAQFVSGARIAGPAPGPENGVSVSGDLVDLRTGALGAVLRSRPNGPETSTMREFNTLANMLVPCARSLASCGRLFGLARAPGSPPVRGTLAAVSAIARNPWHNVAPLLSLANAGPAPYRPALADSQAPDAWTLALRFVGDGASMNGPGNMAIDAHGNVWSTNNYTYSRNPRAPVCGSDQLLEFTPSGQYAAGSPFTGGGLDGAGFGITLDPRGNVWVGNFGFASVNCPVDMQPAHASVSEFSSSGAPISPPPTANSPGGFTQGGVSYPQGMASDPQGDIYTADCANNSVTRYANGNPDVNTQISLPIVKPFDIAMNLRGQLFVTGVGSSSVAMLNPDGSAALSQPITSGGLNRPLGIAADVQGNVWVANSGLIDVPCPDLNLSLRHRGGSITLIHADGTPARRAFTGGGLTIPWGIAVDGNDNVWVANFGGQRLSEFCGARPARCPKRLRTGEPISPSSGYGYNGLVRNTGVQVDPTGNVWVANNWKNYPLPNANPGGYEMVLFIGVAGPIRTPLIGPPKPLS